MYLGSLYSMIAASRSSCIASTTDCRNAANAGSFLLNPMPIGNGMSALAMQYSASCGMILRSGYC